ncbi:MAG TPA: hypothetical protein VES01_06330 [Dermatophilaceae bacterium]|nr:hypothetical protein [Dermatophilaceae bacterium]
MTARRGWGLGLVLCTALLLTSCAAGANPAVGGGPDPAGFWLGLWHGVISPITVIVSFFRDDVSIYEVRNSGNWYDFGFMVGVSIILGGSHGGRRRGERGSGGSGSGRRGRGVSGSATS